MRMLDLFCGRFGWGKAFAARGWEVVGIDLVAPPEVPHGCRFMLMDILKLKVVTYPGGQFCGLMHEETKEGPPQFDFICASSPCEQFSKHGLRCFYPKAPYPDLGIRLFNHTRAICEAAGVPYVMENVRSAQPFVGNATGRAGSFFLWGNAVPPMLPQGLLKGRRLKTSGHKSQFGVTSDKQATAIAATIPPELANCVADYAERILEQRRTA